MRWNAPRISSLWGRTPRIQQRRSEHMHVESNRRRIGRLRTSAGLVLVLASLASVVLAAEFDEKLPAPLMKDAGALRSEAQSFSARFAELRSAGPQQLISSPALSAEQFRLAWQIQQAID